MAINLSSQFKLNAGLPIEESMVVADLTARDAIATVKRFEGLTTYVTAEQKTYQLVGGIENTDWVEFGAAETDPLSVHLDGTTPLTANWDVGEFDITADAFITRDGLSTDFVKGDGTLDSSTYLTSVAFTDLTDYPADASGVLTNDGAGNLSWGAGGGSQTPWTSDIDGAEYDLDNVGDIIHDDATASDWNLINQDQDKDILVKINDGGTERTAIKVHGTEGSVSFPRQSYVRATSSSGQSISANSTTRIVFETEVTDVLGEYDPTTGVFTAKEAGLYQVSAIVVFNSVAWTAVRTIQLLNRDGSRMSYYILPAAMTGQLSISGSNLVSLAAGGSIDVNVNHNRSGGAVTMTSVAGHNVLIINKVS